MNKLQIDKEYEELMDENIEAENNQEQQNSSVRHVKSIQKLINNNEQKSQMASTNSEEININFEQKNIGSDATAQSLPFELTQAEDVLYINQYTIISLEYHYYQNDSKYVKLQQIQEYEDQNGVWLDENDQEIHHQLATNLYQDPRDKVEKHPMNVFDRDCIRNYKDSGIDLLRTQRHIPDNNFMTIKNNDGQPDQYVQGFLSVYRVNTSGQMNKINETDLNMGGKFIPSIGGNMTLTRSKDKTTISLVHFNRDDPKGQFFKIKAWSINLVQVDVSQALNDGLNSYYQENFESFEELVEISFISRQRYLLMEYFEIVEREYSEMQNYLNEIEKIRNSQNCFNRMMKKKDFEINHQKRLRYRKARKYVIFDSNSGEPVFTYGGVNQDRKMKNKAGETVSIYQLGLKIKEIKEQNFESRILFFYAGDIMTKEELPQDNSNFKWGMGFISVALNDLLKRENQNQMIDQIDGKIQQSLLETNYQLSNHYPFCSSWIVDQKFNWEATFDLKLNRCCDQFIMAYTPLESLRQDQNSIYVNGPQFKTHDHHHVSMDEFAGQQFEEHYDNSIPIFKRLCAESVLRLMRNSEIKDQLYYTLQRGTNIDVVCLRPDNEISQKKIRSIQTEGCSKPSHIDVFLSLKTEFQGSSNIDVFKLVQTTESDSKVLVKTYFNNEIIERSSDQAYQQEGDFPCIAYNLGDSKIVIQSILAQNNEKKFILDLDPEERFVSFVSFKDFEDIGFFPDNLQIECCSHFLFLTTSRFYRGKQVIENVLNLLLVDPYYKDIQIALFKSTSVYDYNILFVNDFIKKAFIQSSKIWKNDKSYKMTILAQYNDCLEQSDILGLDMLDNDGFINEAYMSEGKNNKIDLHKEIAKIRGESEIQKVQMVQDSKQFINYAILEQGKCQIMEANPKDQNLQNHYNVFNMNCFKIFGLVIDENDCLYVMTDQFQIHKLFRQYGGRQLYQELVEKSVQPIDRVFISHKPFERMVIKEQYIIYGKKLMYLKDMGADTYPNGIFQAEDLILYEQVRYQQQPQLIQGSQIISGCTSFFTITKISKYQLQINVLPLPDTSEFTLINSKQNQVDFSTFLEDGKIVVRIHNRYMIFESNGKFIDEIEFRLGKLNKILNQSTQQIQDSKKMTIKKFRQLNAVQKNIIQKLNPNKSEILDFEDQIIPEKPLQKPKKMIYEKDMMLLLQFSQNNKYFLFLHKLQLKLIVCELCEIGLIASGKNSYFDVDDIVQSKKREFEFIYQYEINFDESQLFQEMYEANIDPIEYFVENSNQIKMDFKGKVKMCHVRNYREIFIITGSIFQQDGQNCKIENFKTGLDFPQNSLAQIQHIQMQKIDAIKDQMEKIKQLNRKHPRNQHDYTEYQNCIEQLSILERRKQTFLNAKLFYDDLVIVYCGCNIKFAWIQKDPRNKNEFIFKGYEKFYRVNIKFNEDMEIIQIIETHEKNRPQIVVQDHRQKILFVISWDFNTNMEFGMLQIQNDKSTQVCHLIKGMNQKSNYFLTSQALLDLEHNIPIRQINVSQNLINQKIYFQQLSMLHELINQRKLYEDNTVFLGVEKPGSMFYSLNRIDINYWKSMQYFCMDKNIIEKTITIDRFNLTFNGKSLFHYFASKADIIEVVLNLYKYEKLNNRITKQQENFGLQILNPDDEGKTALYHAYSTQCLNSFLQMLKILDNTANVAVSKVMLDVFPYLIQISNYPVVQEFFENAIYKPVQMETDLFLPWNEDWDELIFPSHTSFIYDTLIVKMLQEKGLKCSDCNKKKQQQPQERQAGLNSRQYRKSTMLQKIESIQNIDGEQIKRVSLEALDLDWIFDYDNAQNFLLMLNGVDRSLFNQKSIKIFIELLWEKYQPEIIKRIFIPYMIYLCLLFYLATFGVDIVNEFYDQGQDQIHKYTTYAILSATTCLWTSFTSLELGQLFTDGIIQYYQDIWNFVDTASILCNMGFIICFSIDICLQKEYISIAALRTIGSFVSLLMWLKIFYWMRLFKSFAYYVKLIQDTIIGVKYFMILLFIITLSFSTFFYLNNLNFVSAGNSDSYYEAFTGHSFIDSIISVYCLGFLGSFDSTLYEDGMFRYFVMGAFLVSSFLISVVFMNMLIAIMSDTFTQVNNTAEQSGYEQQVALMIDFYWLVNLREHFKGKKYILRISDTNKKTFDKNIIMERINKCEQLLSQQIKKSQNQLIRVLDNYDTTNRHTFEVIQEQICKVGEKGNDLESLFKLYFSDTKENIEKMKNQTVNKADEVKKFSLLQEINKFVEVDDLNYDDIRRITSEWMEIADKDGNGVLDFEEFQQFFSQLNTLQLTIQQIREIFLEFDTSGDGYISYEEFSTAIYKVIMSEIRAYGQEEDY